MELFPASDDDAWTLIQSVIDDSDYYLIVIAGRYGTVDERGISYTEREFDYAIERGIPVLAFLHEKPGDIPVKKTDQSEKLAAKLRDFTDKITARKHVKFWSSADDLKAKVIQAISAETKRNPREGWVRAGQATDPRRLNELLQEVDRLKADLAAVSTAAPVGTEQYAQGDDAINVSVTYRPKGENYGVKNSLDVRLTWDQVFYELGPMMIEEASERRLHSRLSEE